VPGPEPVRNFQARGGKKAATRVWKARFLMRIIVLILVWAVFFAPAHSSAETAGEAAPGGDSEQLVIQSDTLEVDNVNRRVIFTGNVDAVRDSFTIKCRKMHLYYLGDASGNTGAGENVRVERVVAMGDVKITSADGAEARADEAIYYEEEDKVILTGNPVLKQGGDFVEGARITFYLGEKRSVVESLGRERVRAVISPGGRKR
jgi:lipopolysaccharide export system protein LptA